MELRQLLMFTTIVEEGNISNAAAKLHMTQPPISNQMKMLEEELHCQLFSRGARNITLTPHGEVLYQKAQTMLTLSNQLKNDIACVNAEKSILRLGIISSLSYEVPQSIVPDFSQKYPDIDFDIYEKNTYQMIDALYSHIISLAIIRTPFQNDGLTCYPVKSEIMHAVGHPQYFGAIAHGNSTISLSDLYEQPLIIYRRWRELLDKQFYLANKTPHYFCINDDARTTLSWAKAGLGVGIVPASILNENEIDGLVNVCFDQSLPSSQIYLVHLKNHSLSKAEQDFVHYFC